MGQFMLYEYMKKQGAKPKKELLDANFGAINSSFSDFFNCELFEFELALIDIDDTHSLPNILWYETPSFEFDVLVFREGNFFSNSSTDKPFDISSLVSKKAYTVIKKPKQYNIDQFFKVLISLTPKVNYFTIPLVLFALLIPFYSNMFNSRFIYNDSVVTFAIVTLAFVLLFMFEIIIKNKVKKQSLAVTESNFRQLSDYFLFLFRDSQVKQISVKMRAIEQGATFIWSNLSQLFVELAFILLFSSCMFFMLGSYFLILLCYYLSLAAIMYYIRFSAYKSLIESFQYANDKSTFCYSIEAIKEQMMFSTFLDSSKVFSDKYIADELNRKTLDWQNYCWSELTRFNGFFSMAVMFFTCFLAIKANVIATSVIIAILIINSRLSSSITTLINRFYQLKVNKYHLFKSGEILLQNMRTRKGVTIDGIDFISLKNIKHPVLNRTFNKLLNFHFEAGKSYVFKGPTGSGKTTLLNIIAGINDDFDGEITYSNMALTELSQETFARLVSYHTAKTDFIRTSLVNNFAFYGITDINSILKIIKDCAPNFSINNENLFVIDANDLSFSNGEKQKMLLSMSVFKNPDVIIFDESTSFMSYEDSIKSFNDIRAKNPNSILIFATHDDKLVSYADEVIQFGTKSKVNKVVLNI